MQPTQPAHAARPDSSQLGTDQTVHAPPSLLPFELAARTEALTEALKDLPREDLIELTNVYLVYQWPRYQHEARRSAPRSGGGQRERGEPGTWGRLVGSSPVQRSHGGQNSALPARGCLPRPPPGRPPGANAPTPTARPMVHFVAHPAGQAVSPSPRRAAHHPPTPITTCAEPKRFSMAGMGDNS